MSTLLDRPSAPALAPGDARASGRLRLAVVCVVILLLVFTQSSGLVAADTKLDLVVTPWRFLAHSLTMWDPTDGAGQLQDQAYGYMFPMGPFFLIGHLLQLPAWAVQRAWESAVVIAAFLGTVRLSRLLGVGGFWPRVVAGLAYALAPRVLMEFGVISSELLPVAVAPWVLIPLIQGSRAGSTRRAAARSGVALLFASGINASATVSILPIPALWLLTRNRSRRRTSLAGWWLVATTLASLWWAIPLLVLGRYGSSFLNWIESAQITTGPTSIANSLRGVEHWEAFLGPSYWPSGNLLVTSTVIIIATGLITAMGATGLCLPRVPHRWFLATTLAAGIALVTFGHTGSVHALFAGHEQRALDGRLNAFRNIHKFDPLIRLPLAIGLGHLGAAAGRLPVRRALTLRRRTLMIAPAALSMSAIAWVGLVASAPAWTGNVVAQSRTQVDPVWWHQVGSWLDHEQGRALVVPGAPQAVYVWGAPRDDALQPVAGGPWSVRDATPFSQAGYVRLLDAVEQSLAAGQPDQTLAPVLARADVHYVLVRNDLDTTSSFATPLRFVHATIAGSPGFRLIKTFGPNQAPAVDATHSDDFGLTTPNGSVAVYENMDWQSQVALLPAASTVEANGSSDELPQLISSGLTPDQPVVFGNAATVVDRHPEQLVTDGTRRRDFGFGEINDYSATMTANQPDETVRAAHDYLPAPSPPLSTVTYSGISNVTASSSGALASALINRSTSHEPWSAIDGNPSTSWRVGDFNGAVGQWWEVDLDSPVTVSTATITLNGAGNGIPDRVRVTTDAGSVVDDVTPDERAQPLALPPGSTSYVRVTFLHMADGSPGYSAGISEFSLPGLLAARSLSVPNTVAPDIMRFTVEGGRRAECLSTPSSAAACDPSWQQSGEEDTRLARTIVLPQSQSYVVGAEVTMTDGAALNHLLDKGNPLSATASSVDTNDPRQRPGAAVDGNPTTGWVAGVGDHTPTLRVTLPHPRNITGIGLSPVSGAALAFPTRVEVKAGPLDQTFAVPVDGRVDFGRSVKTRQVAVIVRKTTLRISTDTTSGQQQLLPVGIGELTLLGPNVPTTTPSTTIRTGCTLGPSLTLGGQQIPFTATGSLSAVLTGQPIGARPCARTQRGSLTLPAGTQQLALNGSALTQPDSVEFIRAGFVSPTPEVLTSPRVTRWTATNRSVTVNTPVAAVLDVRENANTGWHATVNGKALRPVTLDGWQQGWMVPAGTDGAVHLIFTPQHTFVAGLGAGAVAVIMLLMLWLLPGRRMSDPVAGPAAPRQWLVAGVVLVTAILCASWVGGLIALAVLAALRLWERRRWWRVAAGATIGLLLAVAALLETSTDVAGPLGNGAGLQVLCLIPLCLLVVRSGGEDSTTPRMAEPPQ